jgi:hypothetical protein
MIGGGGSGAIGTMPYWPCAQFQFLQFLVLSPLWVYRADSDCAVVLLEHVVQIWHWPMPAILGQIAFGLELRDGGCNFEIEGNLQSRLRRLSPDRPSVRSNDASAQGKAEP